MRSITGRYRRIPEINSRDIWKSSHAERQSLNSPIQGSAFDIMMISQLNIERSGICEEYDGHMILSVHDEILFEFPIERSYTGKTLINDVVRPKLMEMMAHPFAMDLKVPLPVSGEVGVSWGACK